MVKNLHFCTKRLLIQLYEGQPGNVIETYRTGFVPNFYSGNIINLNERTNQGDRFICQGEIEWVFPLQYKELNEFSHHNKGIDELKECYKKKFNPQHWLFTIGIRLYPEITKGINRYYQSIPVEDDKRCI
jgi:uncharacterized protein YqfB (UPF0267 family)